MGCLAKSQVRIPSGLGEAQWPQHVVPALWSGNRSNSRCQDAGTWTWTLRWKELLCHSHRWDSTSHKEGVHMSLLWLKGIITCPPPQKKTTHEKKCFQTSQHQSSHCDTSVSLSLTPLIKISHSGENATVDILLCFIWGIQRSQVTLKCFNVLSVWRKHGTAPRGFNNQRKDSNCCQDMHI